MMQFPNSNSNLQRAASPTLSDGSKAKRPLVMDDKIDKKEKIQKVRRLDSPTSPTEKKYVNVPSPQYTSPKTSMADKTISPKAMYPPSIQKYLNGKSQISIEEAVEKLKSPTNKTHKNNLEKMKLLTSLQTQEIESNIMFRKAYSNSTTSVSPTHSGSPVGSPKMVMSPKRENISESGGNIVMTVEESNPGIYNPQKRIDQSGNWNSNIMGQQNLGNFGQGQQQGSYYGNPYPGQMGTNNQNFQMNQGNFMNFQGSGQFNQSQQGIQFNQYGQQPFMNNQQNNNNSNFEAEEPRDRTTSFLMDVGNLGFMNQQNMGNNSQDTKWMVQNQINTIQSLVNTKKTISPGEPSRGLAQMFQKRNSNPENIIRNPMANPLYSQKNHSMGNNMMQGFNNSGNGPQNTQFMGGGMFQDQNQGGFGNFGVGLQAQLNPNQLQQKLYETGMVEQDRYGYLQGMQGQAQGWGNQEQYNNNNNNNITVEKIEENPDSFDPASYFSLQQHKDSEFDMSILQSDLGFIPHGRSFDGIGRSFDGTGYGRSFDGTGIRNSFDGTGMEDQLVLPDVIGLEGLLSKPYGGFKYSNN